MKPRQESKFINAHVCMITWQARRLALSDLATMGQSSSEMESHMGSLKEVVGSITISPSRSHLQAIKDY